MAEASVFMYDSIIQSLIEQNEKDISAILSTLSFADLKAINKESFKMEDEYRLDLRFLTYAIQHETYNRVIKLNDAIKKACEFEITNKVIGIEQKK